ncbi:hypothetical protein SAMN02949497_4774 [Methylomagnum ishizawai]|uniref:Uncharacterized protein n=1 Tax=Methylomagnum ishizawai TaxID=1760988 RepID=A0A1Y6D5N8_9GAMM|nr:hypothetical protein [Methylomagnum ishizawai]SMF97898.1 hypothetical protein SAMN02949497_4754 [Methylomagnum ishizawai]SMF97916.1 hypothetical protein SAMN02949497_4774 [Methylomagnum ishizawai]
MAQKESDKTVMDKFWEGAQKAAQSAFADIGNTYQAFLVRDSTFGALHGAAPEHDKPHSSPEIAKREAEKQYSEPEAPERAPDIEPER